MTQFIYENPHYGITISKQDLENPYHVVNREHNIVEARESNLPQALILAKQFDILLTKDRWAQQLDQMYGSVDEFEWAGSASAKH